jgi:hypothetical protein
LATTAAVLTAGTFHFAVPANADVRIDSEARCVLDLSVDDTCSTAAVESKPGSTWLHFEVAADNNTAWKLVYAGPRDTFTYMQGNGSVYSKTDGRTPGWYYLVLTRDPDEHSGRAEGLLTDR